MHWEKKICIRITLKRIVATVLVASTVINLLIVGVVFGADSFEPAPTTMPAPLTDPAVSTLSSPASTVEETSALPLTDIPTGTSTETPGVSPTDPSTPTQSLLDLPDWPLCIKKFYWPRYRVVSGDTLFSLAQATRSTVSELSSANCLTSSRIYAGQLFYLPSLPGPASAATPTSTGTLAITPTSTEPSTPTSTPTDTPTSSPTPTETASPTPTPSPTNTLSPTPTDSPTEFQISAGMTCDPQKFVSFTATVFDPDGIASVVVRLYTVEDVFLAEIPMKPVEATYSGFTSLPDPYTVYDVDYYRFHALDRPGRVSESDIHRERAGSCFAPAGLDNRKQPTL